LRDRFARQPKWKCLVDAHTYYRAFLEDSPGRALIDHRGPFVGDEHRQTQLMDAMSAGRRVFVVTAPPGCGKSRFALELARRLKTQRSAEVRFVRHDEAALRQELPELAKAKQQVLIVDDAHECPSLVELLADACCSAQPHHLICLTRPIGRAAVGEALANHFAVGEPLEIDLGRPNTKLVRELIDKLIPQLSPHHRDVIRRVVADSFFAAVLLCSRVARQKSLPQTINTRNFREYVIRQPIAQAIRDLCPTDKALNALAVYAACAPVRLGDATIRASAAASSGLSSANIELLEQRLLEAGLFQVDGRGLLHPVPDLVGDLILEETCLNDQGRPTALGQTLMRTLFDGYHEQITRNCADIARLFSTTTRVDLLSDLVMQRADTVSSGMHGEALKLLDSAASLAARQPGTIVRLIDVLTAKSILRAEPPAHELGDPDNLEVHARALLATASEYDPTIVPRAMEYSRRLAACARADESSFRSLRDSLATSCQFGVARPLSHARAILDVLSAWADGSDVEAAELAASLVHGYLQLEMRTHRWEEGAEVSVLVSLAPMEEIWKLRDRALDILGRCTRNSAPAVQFAATDSLQHWARGYTGLTEELRERWAPQLDRELDVLAESFSKLGAATAHLPARAAVEHQGWRWWIDELNSLTHRGGKRILEALAEAKPGGPMGQPGGPMGQPYSLWKALHDGALPIFPVPLDETIEPSNRRERLAPVIEPTAERTVELAKELFDQLDPLHGDSFAWVTAFTAALGAQPQRPLQPRAPIYVAEFVKRHPVEAWSFVTEESANGSMGAILPALLVELRAQDSQRWQEAIQKSMPGTRLFEVELAALCAASELDAAERIMVSRALEMDDPGVVHLSAQALLNAAPSALAPGLSAAYAVLPTRPRDERLWELTLDAFARWGSPVLAAPEGEEASPETRAISGELLKLLRAHGGALSWERGPHTRQLATVVAILAVAVPHTLKVWMRELWSPTAGEMDPESPLSMARFKEIARLMGQSPTATYWQKQFVEWMTDEPDLALVGARGLAGMCAMTHACVVPLVTRIARQLDETSIEALGEFVRSHSSEPRFVEDAVALLRQLVDAPEGYGLLEKQIIAAMTRAPEQRQALLRALERSVQNVDLPVALRETLARAKEALQAATEEDLLIRQ